MPFAESMFKTAKSMQDSISLTIGGDTVEHVQPFIPPGLDIIKFHVNFPPTPEYFESAINSTTRSR